ncbi:hypothetical protein [Inquilinus sp.]|uniref:hypothetical protein n=1 Tax=Inquilinus sp. TaxID=1932117 RepID=UPI003782D324
MSFGGILRFLNPVRRPGEAGEMFCAAMRSTRAPAPAEILNGKAPSRMLQELQRTVILSVACGAVAGIAGTGLYLMSGNELQLIAGLLLAGVFAAGGLAARRRESIIAAWLERT